MTAGIYNLKSAGRKGPSSFYYFVIVPPLSLPMMYLLICLYIYIYIYIYTGFPDDLLR